VTLSISISERAEAELRSRAAEAGLDVETYVAQQVERLASPLATFEELSRPIAQAFAESGMTEDELADFLEEEKHAMRAERRARAKE
jgi:hypothetical protein